MMLTLHEYERRFFPHRLALHHLLCYHIDLCGNSQKGYLGFYAHPFMTCHFCCCQAWTQAHRRWVLPLVVLAQPLSRKLLCSTPGGTRIKGKSNQGFNGEDLDINLGCHQVYPWCISTTPGWQNEGGWEQDTFIGKRQVSSGQGRTLRWKISLQPHLEQGQMPPVEKSHGTGRCFFSLLQMGANSSRTTPLNKNWDNFDPQGLKIPYIWGFFALRDDLTCPERYSLLGHLINRSTPVIRANLNTLWFKFQL